MKKLLSELIKQVGQDSKSRFLQPVFPSKQNLILNFLSRREVAFLNKERFSFLTKIHEISQNYFIKLRILPRILGGTQLLNGPQQFSIRPVKLTQGFLFILTLQETPVKGNNKVQILCSFHSSPTTHLCQMLQPGQQWGSLVRSKACDII